MLSTIMCLLTVDVTRSLTLQGETTARGECTPQAVVADLIFDMVRLQDVVQRLISRIAATQPVASKIRLKHREMDRGTTA